MNYKKQDVVKCVVTAIEHYGFFVSTELGYSGLVHISEMTSGYVRDINNFVKVNDVIYCIIKDIDDNTNKLTLSIKNINYKALSNNAVVNDFSGFLPLKKQLVIWMREKEEEYKNL